MYGCVRLWVSRGGRIFLNTILIFYQAIFKLTTKDYYSSFIRDYNVHGYWNTHVVSTKFAIVVIFLLLYCVTANHPVTGSIIVTAFKIRGSFIFLHIYRGM